MNTLYIHIGMPKTGTTSIQNFCADNRRTLNQNGYDYPIFSHRYEDVAPVRNGHFLVAGQAQNGQLAFTEEMAHIQETFRTYSNIILSDEIIWAAPRKRMDMWHALKAISEAEGFRVKMIVYLRRQDLYLCSIWNQYIKSKASKQSWEDFMQNPGRASKMDYGKILNHIASVFDKESVTVRRFETQHFYNGSLYADFLQTVGLELTNEYVIQQYRRNTKLGGNTHEIMRVINGIPGIDLRKSRFFRNALLSYAELSEEEYASQMFSEKEAKAFMANYAEENKQVSEMFFDGAELFDMTWADCPKWENHNPHMQDDIIRFTGACVMRLMAENEKLYQKLDKQAQDLQDFKNKLKHPIRAMMKRP